jgi:hypothetical protein
MFADFERANGSIDFLKASCSALLKLLVYKNLVNVAELTGFMSEEVLERIADHDPSKVKPSDGAKEKVGESTNFLQTIPCECGGEEMCLCGRCKKCGKQRHDPKLDVPKEDRLANIEKLIETLWTEVFEEKGCTANDTTTVNRGPRQTLRGAVVELCKVNNINVDDDSTIGDFHKHIKVELPEIP